MIDDLSAIGRSLSLNLTFSPSLVVVIPTIVPCRCRCFWWLGMSRCLCTNEIETVNYRLLIDASILPICEMQMRAVSPIVDVRMKATFPSHRVVVHPVMMELEEQALLSQSGISLNRYGRHESHLLADSPLVQRFICSLASPPCSNRCRRTTKVEVSLRDWPCPLLRSARGLKRHVSLITSASSETEKHS